jgi:hypothetical protein
MAQQKFSTIQKAVTAEQITEARATVEKAFEARAEFQRTKDPANEKIQDVLKASKKALSSDPALKTMIACGVDLAFVNKSSVEGSSYNVYAIQKVVDLVAALDTGIVKNAVNNAVTRSLFAFKSAGEKFTGEMARAAVSDKLRVQGQIAKLLIRHTVSPATAPTQMSSTMSALATLGIVENKGTRREPVYEVADTPQAKRLGEIVAKAA